MTKHVNVPALNRRRLLKAAGLTFALTIAPDALATIDDAFAEETKPAPYKPDVWLTIAPDGTITVVSPAAEMGQGSFTTLPLIIAEELDAAVAGRWKVHHHDRGVIAGRQSSAAKSLDRRAGAAMRLLPIGPDHAGGDAARRQQKPLAGRHCHAHGR